ncbi:MAG: dihydrolipoyl dehydrogenase [Rhodocyclaceae bacterium]|jgi:dihydrolipoamide dehydrogenase|nr:dihydrolipoyl dehydrogenase [Rhodocyclaceae bacterium]
MKTLKVDVAIIGAGTAGLAAYRAAKGAGANALIIEGGDYGTTCARVGCMPSKLLIAAADAAHAVGQAPFFGIHVDGGVRISGREVMDRVRHERDRFVEFVRREVQDIAEADRICGHARFADDHTVVVADYMRVETQSTVIATGSQSTQLDSFKAVGDRLIVSDDLFDWHDLPNSVAVVGMGIIALELAQALHRLGVYVVVLGRGGRLGPIGDPDIRNYAIATFNEEFTLAPDAHIELMGREDDQAVIGYSGPNGTRETGYFDYVLAAAGRTPNLTGMDIDKTTLEFDAKGALSFDSTTARTASTKPESPIFVAGDASNHIPLLHEAADEGRIAGENAARFALGSKVIPRLRRAPLGVVFTDPQIAIVGGGFHALPPGAFATGRASFEDQGRARIMLKNKGLLHVYGDLASGDFLGAEMFAPAAEHLAHLLAWALQNKMTVAHLLQMPFYHPVVEEGLRSALRALDGKLRHAHDRR